MSGCDIDTTLTNFSKQLASSEQRIREKSLEDLRNWMSCSPFEEINEDDMMKLWLGLYMSMWMADKPLVQEKLAENLASLVDCLSNSNEVFQFVGAFFKIIRREWSKIDRLRIDKFYMLIRTMLGCTLQYLQQQKWDDCIIDQYLQLMPEALNISQTFSVADGVTFHLVDIYLDELKKAYDSDLSNDAIINLLRPFIHLLATTPDVALRKAISDSIFNPLAGKMVGKLSINPTAMAAEFYNLAKDSQLPRSTANRKCLYQLHERFANIQMPVDNGNQESAQRDVVVSKDQESSTTKKWKGGDNKEIRKKTRKRKSMDDKEPSSDIETTSHNVTKDIDSNTDSSYRSNNDRGTVVIDVRRLELTKKPWKLRKRSLPSVASDVLSAGATSSSKKKRSSLHSIHEECVTEKRIPSPIMMVTRSGRQVGGPSKKVHFEMLKNEIFEISSDKTIK